MRVAVPKERFPDERRVGLIPASVAALTKLGLELVVERGAGTSAGYPDAEYEAKGAKLVDRAQVFAAEIVCCVRTFGTNPEQGKADLAQLREGQFLIGLGDPLSYPDRAQTIAETGATFFALELIPRITRAQSMDVLSSMATIAGYKAVLVAANRLPKMFPMFMTAAGTVQPARVFIVGAGVAGLQAIASAKRLGAVVHAYDVRPAVKEQIQSLGAKFVEFNLETQGAEDKGGYAKALGEEFYEKQRALMGEVVKASDVIVTTAAIPGKPSPVLITRSMVDKMAPGSVIVDLAAERGGNCELTKLDEEIDHQGVTILGPGNITSTVPFHASQMYANNVVTFLKHLVKNGSIQLDLEDEITKGTLAAREKHVVHPTLRALLGLESEPKKENV